MGPTAIMHKFLMFALIMVACLSNKAAWAEAYPKAKTVEEAHELREDGKLRKAIKLYLEAAEAGNPEAMNAIGIMALNGIGMSKNEARAFSYIKDAAEMGYPNAQKNMAVFYEKGIRVKKNQIKADYWYAKYESYVQEKTKFVELREGDLQKLINDAEDHLFLEEFDEAESLLRQLAKQGHVESMFQVGRLHLNGLVTDPSDNTAKVFLQRSAILGNAAAISILGQSYARGLFTEKNLRVAKYYHEIAGNMGELGSIIWLASETRALSDQDRKVWNDKLKDSDPIELNTTASQNWYLGLRLLRALENGFFDPSECELLQWLIDLAMNNNGVVSNVITLCALFSVNEEIVASINNDTGEYILVTGSDRSGLIIKAGDRDGICLDLGNNSSYDTIESEDEPGTYHCNKALQKRAEAEQARLDAERELADTPYLGVLSCSMYGNNVSIMACFVDCHLEVITRNGVARYTAVNIRNIGRQTSKGVEFPLPRSFQVKGCNSGDNAVLGFEVYDRATGSFLGSDSAPKRGWINLSN